MRIFILGLVLVVGIAFQALGQVSGVVTDSESGEILPGVNVLVKGTGVGTATDINGNYQLDVPSLQDTLVFRYVGYKTIEVPINGRTEINVEMVQEAIRAQELVVVGYAVKEAKHLTESVSTISSEALQLSPTINVANSLAGKASGLFITQRSGYPFSDAPNIYVRGIASLSPSDAHPLILVDGVKRNFFHLNPDNIKSVTVLKDAAATAIYGIEGANGVILVKTKRGKKGPAQFSINMSAGFQQPVQQPEFIGSYRYAKLYNRAQISDGIDPSNVRFSEEAIRAFKTGNYPLIYPDMDWIDYLTKEVAFQTQNSISVSGGTDFVRYYLSGGYLFQDGIFKIFDTDFNNNPSYKKYNFRANLDMDVTPTTTVSLTSYGRVGTHVRIGNISDEWGNIYHGAPFAGAGLVKVEVAPDSYEKVLVTSNSGVDSPYIPGDKHDPLKPYYSEGVNKYTRSVINVDLEIRQELDFITKGLSVQLKASYNTSYQKAKKGDGGEPEFQAFFRTDVDPTAPADDSTLVFKQFFRSNPFLYNESYDKDRRWYMEARIDYSRDFGPHSISALLLYNQRKSFYPADYTGIPRGILGFVGRIDYSYDDRYLLQVNMGYNGSENFAKGNRYGLFPSIAAGWIVSNEAFMDEVDFIDYLKLKASYGIVGNDQGLGRFLYLPTTFYVNGNNSPGYSFGYHIPENRPTATEGSIGNPLVGWEIAHKQNYGIDLWVLNSRLKFSFEYFYEFRSDILTTLNTVPEYVAAPLPAVNIGEVENWGYEIELDWKDQISSDLSYRIGTNISFARNKVLEMDEIHHSEPYLYKTGHSVGQRFGYIFDRFYQQSDFTENGALKNKFAQPLYQPKPGDLKYKDLNADGRINAEDRRAIGYPTYPEYMFGITMGVKYKNFSLTLLWQGATHVSRMFGGAPYRVAFGLAGRGGYGTLKWQADGAWTPEKGQSAIYPRLSTEAARRRQEMDSNFWMHDGSYIRLKNVRLSYQLPVEFVNGLGVENILVYVNGYDLLTFSELGREYGLDPERSTTSTAYPIMKVYNFGINIDF